MRWAVLALALLTSCAEGRQFTRATVSHYASESEVYTSSTTTTIGRYLEVSDELEAEVYTGTYYDLDGSEVYGLVGTGLTWSAEWATTSLTLEGLVPEAGGELEWYGSASVEVPWP